MSDEHGPPTEIDLVRWSEALSSIAKTGLGFSDNLYERERFEEVLAVAADIRVASGRAFDTDTQVIEWMKQVGDGVAGYVTPKVAVGAVVGDEDGRILLVQRSDSGIWLYPTGWCDVGYSASEVVLKEVYEETGIEAEIVAPIAIFDGLRLGFTGIPLYSIVFACRPIGGELKPHPLECRDVGWFAEDELPEPLAGRRPVAHPCLPGHPGRAGPGLVRPAPPVPLASARGGVAMTDPTAIEIAESVRSGERSAREVLEHYLARIDAGNEALNAFVHLDADLAGEAAARVDAAGRRRRGPRARSPGCPSGSRTSRTARACPPPTARCPSWAGGRWRRTRSTWPGSGRPGASRSARPRRRSSARSTSPRPRPGG